MRTDYLTRVVPQVVCIVMLLWALNPSNPYGYYILLRIVVCAACAYLAFQAAGVGKAPWVWILGVTAVIYNPIASVHLTRGLWSIINVVTVIMLSVTFWSLRKGGPQSGEGRAQ
jgi:uncharacterized membrane protein YwzB